jgi:hypothetical protein
LVENFFHLARGNNAIYGVVAMRSTRESRALAQKLKKEDE